MKVGKLDKVEILRTDRTRQLTESGLMMEAFPDNMFLNMFLASMVGSWLVELCCEYRISARHYS
jgi:hypothetical protein